MPTISMSNNRFGKIILVSCGKNEPFVTFKISTECLQIKSFAENSHFFSIQSPRFFSSGREMRFSVLPKMLISAIALVRGIKDTIQLHFDGTQLVTELDINSSATMKIKIPCIALESSDIQDIEHCCAKIMLSNIKAISQLPGIVSIHLAGSKLTICRDCQEVKEVIECEIEPFEGNTCSRVVINNNISHPIAALGNHVEQVQINFGNDRLQLQFLLKNYDDAYYEIQMPLIFDKDT